MTKAENALDIAREVCPGLEWHGGTEEAWASVDTDTLIPPHYSITLSRRAGGWWGLWSPLSGERSARDPRAGLRDVRDEVRTWALNVFRSLAPAEDPNIEDPEPLI